MTELSQDAKAIYSHLAAVLSSPRALLIPADVRELLAAVAVHLVNQAARIEALQQQVASFAVSRFTTDQEQRG